MNNEYKILVLDPRCLKPVYIVNDERIYGDAIDAINKALKHRHITKSEKRILEQLKIEVRKNRFYE